MHNVRLMWLKAANYVLLDDLEKIDKENITKEHLIVSLKKSGLAMESLLEFGFEHNQIKEFRPYPTAFFGYLISHESHHRGQIVLSLKQSGNPVDKKVMYGIWEWGVR